MRKFEIFFDDEFGKILNFQMTTDKDFSISSLSPSFLEKTGVPSQKLQASNLEQVINQNLKPMIQIEIKVNILMRFLDRL